MRSFTSTQKRPCALTTTGSRVRSEMWGTSRPACPPTPPAPRAGPGRPPRGRGHRPAGATVAEPAPRARRRRPPRAAGAAPRRPSCRPAPRRHRRPGPAGRAAGRGPDRRTRGGRAPAAGPARRPGRGRALGEPPYGVGDVAAGAQVDPHQATVGLVQHRRVGHLHGHRVSDLRRDRLRLVRPVGEAADEVDAVGRQQVGLRGRSQPLRLPAPGGQARPRPGSGVDAAGAELDLRLVGGHALPRGVAHGPAQCPDRRIRRAIDGHPLEPAGGVEGSTRGDQQQRDVGACRSRQGNRVEERVAVGQPVGHEHHQDGVGLAGVQHGAQRGRGPPRE